MVDIARVYNGTSWEEIRDPYVFDGASWVRTSRLNQYGGPWNGGDLTGPGRAPPWSPLSLTGLYQWFDAQDAATITKDGSNYVTQWDDKSGNAGHLTATGTNGPTYESTALNSLPAMTFHLHKGLDNATIYGLEFLANQLDIEIIMVFTQNTASVNGCSYIYWSQNTSSSHKMAIDNWLLVAPRFRFSVSQDGISNWIDYTASSKGFSTATPYVFRWKGSLSTGYPTTYLNLYGDTTDIEFADPVPNPDPWDAGASQMASLGGMGAQLGNGSEYSLGELILVRGILTSQEIIDVNLYLKARWGI